EPLGKWASCLNMGHLRASAVFHGISALVLAGAAEGSTCDSPLEPRFNFVLADPVTKDLRAKPISRGAHAHCGVMLLAVGPESRKHCLFAVVRLRRSERLQVAV